VVAEMQSGTETIRSLKGQKLNQQNINANASETTNTSANTWGLIDAMFGEHTEFRSKMEALRSPKRVKKMIKQMVSGSTQSEAVAELELLMKAMRSAHINRATESRDALIGVNMDIVEKSVPLDSGACEAEISQYKMDWNVYTIS